MNFEPQKFFVGLMDFFSILLPGALLAWLLMAGGGPLQLPDRVLALSGAAGWAAFLFASFLLGHLVFLLGALLDRPYDWLRERTLNRQIETLARHGRLLSWWVRLPAGLLFKEERNLAVDRAGRLKRRSLRGLQAGESVNTFQWAKAWLQAESPASLAQVERFEAHSKFFRCLAVVLALVFVSLLREPRSLAASVLVLVLLVLALWRFMDQRYKATNQAYWCVLTLAARAGQPAFEPVPVPPSQPPLAAGVVYRKRGSQAEVLLVEDSRGPRQWVLPKGQVESGEPLAEAAVRGVHAEAGVWARIVRELDDVSLAVDGTAQDAKVYLMEQVGRGLRKDRMRQRAWLPLEQALARASHVETRELLLAAQQRLANQPGAAPAPPRPSTST